jgi:hypothetical protein
MAPSRLTTARRALKALNENFRRGKWAVGMNEAGRVGGRLGAMKERWRRRN